MSLFVRARMNASWPGLGSGVNRDQPNPRITDFLVAPSSREIPGVFRGLPTLQLRMASLTFALTSALAWAATGSTATWEMDPSWPRGLPQGVTYFSAPAIERCAEQGRKFIHVSARSGGKEPILVFTPEGDLVDQWGSESISFNATTKSWGAHGVSVQTLPGGETRIWVADIQDHTAKVFSGTCGSGLGETRPLLGTSGIRGRAGSDTRPNVQFGSTADVASGMPWGKFAGQVWVSDGDGGVNNRVVQLNTTDGFRSIAGEPMWTLGGNASDTTDFNSPHSIAFHERSASVIVADRGNARVRIVEAATGVVKGSWSCPDLQTQGGAAVWGVRVWQQPTSSSVWVAAAIADFPAVGKNQKIVIYNASSTDLGDQPCDVIASWDVPTDKCDTPHELDVDPETQDIYLACVTVKPGPSAILRYTHKPSV